MISSCAIADDDLIERFRSRCDGKAARELVDRHSSSVYRLVYRMLNNIQDSEDLTQSTFSKAFAALDSYREENRFRPWILQIARNEALSLIRYRKRRPQIERDIQDSDLQVDNPTGQLSSRESIARILSAIASLPDAEKEVVYLRIQDELTFQEIAELTETPLGTVLSRMHEARKRLRPILTPDVPTVS